MPAPDYASRLMLWKTFVAKQLAPQQIPGSLDVSTLARISDGFTGGSIERCVKKTLTKRRLSRLDKRPLAGSEFLNAMAFEDSKTFNTRKEELSNLNNFTRSITELDKREAKIAALSNPDEGDDKKGSKKGKK